MKSIINLEKKERKNTEKNFSAIFKIFSFYFPFFFLFTEEQGNGFAYQLLKDF